MFEIQPVKEKINLTLAVLAERKIDNGYCIKFEKRYFEPINSNGNPVHYYRGSHFLVINAFNGELFGCINEQVYALEEVPTHQHSSKNFDFKKLEKPKKRYIPPMDHPWKKPSFQRYVESQKHTKKVN